MTLVPKALGTPWAEPARHPWTLRRLKDVARVVNGYPFDSKLFDADGKHALVRIRDLNCTSTETRYSGAWVTAASIDTGDVLVGMDGDFNVGTWQGGPALLNQRMCCVRGESALMSRFLRYVLPTPLTVTNDLTYFTTVKHLSSLDVERLTIPVPPTHLLGPLVNFLDEQTARIDALIAEKDCLQERLSEYRRSLVSNAVTQGVPGRHTDLLRHDFLGFVPKGWGVGKFRHYVQVRSGQVNPEDQAYANLVLVAPNHIESGTGRLLSTESAVEQSAESGKYWCDAGDVIYSKIRPALRKATVAPFDCLCSADMYPLKGLGPLSNQYLFWYLLSEPFSDFAVQESMRVAMPKLNRETLADAVIPLPSPNEQTEIVAYVKRATAAVDDVASHVAEHIARLREYRSSLISAAVTGQLDLSTFKAAE